MRQSLTPWSGHSIGSLCPPWRDHRRDRSTDVRVLAALSGGVDSSVAAALLVESGHEVVAVTMKLWGGDSDTGCCSVGDVADARRSGCTTRAGSPRVQLHRGVQPARGRPVCGRPCRRAHAQPVCGMQPAPQVRRAAGARRTARLRRRRHRAPRAGGHPPRRNPADRPGRGRGQGPVLRAAPAGVAGRWSV